MKPMTSRRLPHAAHRRHHRMRQRGVTLVELMVGIAIGLLVVAVAMGALMVSRGVSGTVSDASGIQQQGSHVLRMIGQQLRQAGSLYLNPDPAKTGSNDVLIPVAFEIKAASKDGGNSFDSKDTLIGGANTFTTGFRRYKDEVFVRGNDDDDDDDDGEDEDGGNDEDGGILTDTLARNCLGHPKNASTDERVESIFTLANNELRCGGNGTTAQPIAQNVAQFQLTYLVQTVTGGTGTTVQYRAGSDMPTDAGDPAWRRVQGVQVCFVLYGSEPIDLPSGSSYTDCEGNSVDMTTLTGARRNRMHLLFRNTFQVRSQGLL